MEIHKVVCGASGKENFKWNLQGDSGDNGHDNGILQNPELAVNKKITAKENRVEKSFHGYFGRYAES